MVAVKAHVGSRGAGGQRRVAGGAESGSRTIEVVRLNEKIKIQTVSNGRRRVQASGEHGAFHRARFDAGLRQGANRVEQAVHHVLLPELIDDEAPFGGLANLRGECFSRQGPINDAKDSVLAGTRHESLPDASVIPPCNWFESHRECGRLIGNGTEQREERCTQRLDEGFSSRRHLTKLVGLSAKLNEQCYS
jgi:hypothetical protein